MASTLIKTQAIGRIIFDERDRKVQKSDVVVSPFGGVNANPHRPPMACSLYDTLGLSTAVHPSPTFVEPYTGETLAGAVSIGMSLAMIFGARDKGRFSFFVAWFFCICFNFVAAKSLAMGNGVLGHQLAVTACGLVSIGTFCKMFMEVIYAGGFGATIKNEKKSGDSSAQNSKTSAAGADAPQFDANASVLSTGRSFEHLEKGTGIVGGVTAAEAAEELRAEIAAKGGRRIITEADVKRRMELLNTDRLRSGYTEAAKAARLQINEHLKANELLEAQAAAKQIPAPGPSPTSAPARKVGEGMAVNTAAPPKAAFRPIPTESLGTRFMRGAVTVGILGKYVARNNHTKVAVLFAGLTYYNYRRLDWWGSYVPELRALKGREDSSSGINVYKGTYSDTIDAELLAFKS